MISLKNKYKRLFASVLILAIISCSNPWDDRIDNGDANLKVNLSEAIANTPEVSQFAQLLVQAGYDKVLADSKSYTVFVPTNEAMAQVSAEILNDSDALNKFIRNHITLTTFSSIRKEENTQIRMFGTKYLTFKGSTMIDDATIVSADHYAKNGVFHIIDKALTPKLNIWEYVKSQDGNSAMSHYLLSLKAFSIYTSDVAGKTLSESIGAGYLADSLTNSYLKNVYNLNNEKNSYTLFLMEDAGYNSEVTKVKPYLIKPSNSVTVDSTAIYSSYFTARDMAFPKKYEIDELPATLTSRFGVEVPVDKTQIVGQPIHLSNGIVYIMKKVDVPLQKRLVTTKIEGEKLSSFLPSDRRTYILYRDRIDPAGVFFNDVFVSSPGVTLFTLNYNAKDMFSTTFKVYWRAYNNRSAAISQKLRVGGNYNTSGVLVNVIKDFGYVNVQPNVFDEIYLGDVTLTNSGNIDLISLIAGTTSTSELTLDYLKFVPQVKP
ncbi:Uncaracterized surface protein containing fasciclin (FAS1) repeats [Flavobacterium glycines]|uniref:Uncaracterized surface protein containing fasciclin (FAS1) repeats n=1 Tax=Flavobacterium glycines TaxID=551990 RepID=A0A1B9DMX7_9FLAO|nr:fasciclin domain-containing protein [Flavobacterium glycines]OCB71009.1 hypothetical protein FBGL_11185 [Flavobacterium glycines]GEL10821.1 hypothetical protein FGL01_15600 [Flavobacterium glycines]SDI52852.1 Uncaracterized surface protein containing fasciclin (FAS1) repeats [Flavobacterium glycines]